MAIPGCSDEPPHERYNQADRDLLRRQREQEQRSSGMSRFGPQVYRGYQGLSALPWFDLDEHGKLQCIDDSVPLAIDMHSHLGISVLLAPDINLQARTERTRHLLDCDAPNAPCRLDLDVYANANFTEEDERSMQRSTLAQGLWGSDMAATQTIPNLLAEMDAMRVKQSVVLPIKMGLPFGDNLTSRWLDAIDTAKVGDRLVAGLSVHPRGADRIQQLRSHAARGARVMKLHPTVQAFYPDDPDMMELYEEAQRLGIVLFFHGGRAGIEPESRQRYAMPRHYEAVLNEFPKLQVVLGHGGARDGSAMLEMAVRYENAWLGIHGQSISALDTMINRTGGERLLFGSDWPFYHIGMSLAKVLLVTEEKKRHAVRSRILQGNALELLPALAISQD
ncbi:amidohydrolase [Halioglobus maricola]|uniref:Amidohydrolase n=2 Tax=Halioglobus maricola TaxID=2601894 RepID=A0A5P9NPS0_9GAMM|nr:amidohydrolase [Halioglobus maricola]